MCLLISFPNNPRLPIKDAAMRQANNAKTNAAKTMQEQIQQIQSKTRSISIITRK